jgi:hypothetical protein
MVDLVGFITGTDLMIKEFNANLRMTLLQAFSFGLSSGEKASFSGESMKGSNLARFGAIV